MAKQAKTLRPWRELQSPVLNPYLSQVKQQNRFRVMSYNILADYLMKRHRGELYPRTPNRILSWSNRWELIYNEISDLRPDILCLQEVDRFEEIQSDLSSLGYSGQFLCRTGGCLDGCATFWRSEIELLDISHISFSRSRVLKDNVALLTVVCMPGDNPVPLVIANTHILFNPKRGDIKLAQVRTMCDEASKLMSTHEGIAIICGDFNSTPNSGIYNFLTQGQIRLSEYSSYTLSGTMRSGFSTSRAPLFGMRQFQMTSDLMFKNMFALQKSLSMPPFRPPNAQATEGVGQSPSDSNQSHRQWWPGHNGSIRNPDQCIRKVSTRYDFLWACGKIPHPRLRAQSERILKERFLFLRNWRMENFEIAMGQFLPTICDSLEDHDSTFLIGHEMELKSSYTRVLGNEPHFTSLHSQAKTTLDYIFFTPMTQTSKETLYLEPMGVLGTPKSIRHRMLPNEDYGSDHLCLCVEFAVRKLQQSEERNELPKKSRLT